MEDSHSLHGPNGLESGPHSSTVPFLSSVVSSLQAPAKLGRKPGHLGVLGVAILGYTVVCGGPFGIEPAVGGLGPALAIACCTLLAIFWAVPQASITAELATAMPSLGGQVDWVHAALGRVPGIANSWVMAFWELVDLPSAPLLLASYVSSRFPAMSNGTLYGIQFAVVLVAFVLNVLGIDALAISGGLLSFLVYLPFISLPIAAAAARMPMDWGVFSSPASSPSGWSFDVPVAVATLLWCYNGYWALGTLTLDVKGIVVEQHDDASLTNIEPPHKSVTPRGGLDGPKRFAIGTLLAVLLCTMNFIFPMAIGSAIAPNMGDWQAGFFVTLGDRVSPGIGNWLFVAAILNNMVCFNTCFGAYCRGIQASALRGDIPIPFLGRNMTRWQTPVPALVVAGVVCCILMSGFGFDTLIVIDSSVSIAMSMFLFASFVALRYKQPDLHRPFRIPGPFLAGAWIVILPMCVLILLSLVVLCYQAYWGPLACVGIVGISFAGAWYVNRRMPPAYVPVSVNDGLEA